MKSLVFAVLASVCLHMAFAGEASHHLPTLAMTVVAEGNQQQKDSFDDLLAVELSHQSVLRIVDRQKMRAILKEHAIALSNIGNAQNAIALGKFVGADYLLHVSRGKKTAALRLVEVASGQVKVEGEVALRDDLTLSAVAIREKVLAALRPESQAAHRLTVGIAAFPNRSGTDRSDKLGIELQKALRKRLQERPWAVVLERQYPTALLEEADLARAGLTRGKAIESLPPADLVILGSLEDCDRSFDAGMPWSVRFDLTLCLRGQNTQVVRKCSSDGVGATADHIMAKIDELWRRPTSPNVILEKELWRRQALYLMPDPCETTTIGAVPNFYSSSAETRKETIRAWENILLLDGNDADAMTRLGFCLIGFNGWAAFHDQAAVARVVAGSRLVERGFRSAPNNSRADTLVCCLETIRRVAPTRAREMAEFIADHRNQFKHADHQYVKSALVAPASGRDRGPGGDETGWTRAIQRADKDPDTLILSMSQVIRGERSYEPNPVSLKRNATILAKYLDSRDPVVQFVVHTVMGQMLCRTEQDPAGLEHLAKATDLLEKASARCSPAYSYHVNQVYRLRVEACLLFGRQDEAKQTALVGTKQLMTGKRFDESVAWLYNYCAMEALGPGQEKEALAVCNAYLAAAGKTYLASWDPAPGIAVKREELLARLAGKPIPSLGGLRLVKGTGPQLSMRMAATEENVWMVSSQSSGYAFSGGLALRCGRGDESVTKVLPDMLRRATCVAATKNYLFFGGPEGLYKLDTKGTFLKHYDQKDGAMPRGSILDLCAGGGKIYFAFQGTPRYGIGVMDPASDKISILVPSGREVKDGTEPRVISQVRWDAVGSHLYARFSHYPTNRFPWITYEYIWTPENNTWQRLFAHGLERPKGTPQLIVSQGDETVIVIDVGESAEFQFQKTGQKVTADVPIRLLMGEPAWDEHRLWAATPSGLYEIDRNTGRVDWLAYEKNNLFMSVLKHGSQLYVATSQGLYCRQIPEFAGK